jgi:hypothetical protein
LTVKRLAATGARAAVRVAPVYCEKHMATDLSQERYSFDEFKLYYDSTEKVTDRRLETNRWNYSICIATLVAIAVLTKWSLAEISLVWVGLVAVALLSLMAIVFCALWVDQIKDFKKLNTAKFMVLNQMAPRLEFDTDNPGAVVSFLPFEREWEAMKALNALDEIGDSKIIALKSSNIEYFVPKAFAFVFATVLSVLTVIVILNWPPARLVSPTHVIAPSASVPGKTP